MNIKESNCDPKRQPIAQDLLDFIDRIAEKSKMVAEHVDQKLISVMLQPIPTPELNCKEIDSREYPPLFNEMNNRLLIIESALDKIEYALNRTEL